MGIFASLKENWNNSVGPNPESYRGKKDETMFATPQKEPKENYCFARGQLKQFILQTRTAGVVSNGYNTICSQIETSLAAGTESTKVYEFDCSVITFVINALIGDIKSHNLPLYIVHNSPTITITLEPNKS